MDTPRFPHAKEQEDRDFSAFGTQVEFPRNSGRARRFMMAATLMVAALLAGMAGAIWLQPDVLPQGIAMIKRTAWSFGIEVPGDGGGMPRKFGTSPGELPYDGRLGAEEPPEKTVRIPAAHPPQTASRSQEESSGASGTENGNAAEEKNAQSNGAAADVGEPQPSTKPAEPISQEEADDTKTAKVEATKTEPAPAAKPPSGKNNISHAIRKKEISRLRKQAAEELYAE